MTLSAVLAALALDLYVPLRRPTRQEYWLQVRAAWLHERLDASGAGAGWITWVTCALLPAALAGMLGGLLHAFSSALAWGLATLLLYHASGYRDVVARARDVVGALTVADLERGRRFCADWCQGSEGADIEAMADAGIRAVLRLALYRLIAPIFWFTLAGLFGLVLYALTRGLMTVWPPDTRVAHAYRSAVHILEWPAARALALSFAVVGNFEQVLAAWRALPASAGNMAVTLAAGAGALGVRTAEAGPVPGDPAANWEAPSAEYLEGSLRLVLRVLVLWLAVLVLVWLAAR